MREARVRSLLITFAAGAMSLAAASHDGAGLAVAAPAKGAVGQASVPDTAGLGGITEEQRRELERIGTLGYTVGGDKVPEASGLTVREPDAWKGYTVYVSGDFPGAFLLDMDGNVVHTWREEKPESWTRVHVYPNGDILGVSAYPGRLIKLDGDSNILWKYGTNEHKAHHDVTVGPDGKIYVLMREALVLQWLREQPLLDDRICILDSFGRAYRTLDCISIPDAFRNSEFDHWIMAPGFGRGDADPFHTNSVEVLDGRVPHPAFRAGNILVSIRNMDCLAVIDPEKRAVVWMNAGRWQRQHEARVTPDGTLLLFDNRSFDGNSRIVEYDVQDDEIVWSYEEDGFYSRGTGAQQLLPNGNLLITESQKGRVFEVTREGRLVWEFWNPSRMSDGETIVRVTRAFRVPYDYFDEEFRGELP